MPSPRHIAVRIVRTLQDAGQTAYFAGGCVRDELLGLSPQDYDVATDATPEQVRQLFGRVSEVGASFGVMLVGLGEHTIEVATFRVEGNYSDHRRPDDVHYADAPSDARRRDFTINALFLDPLAPADDSDPHSRPRGAIIDYVNGMSDLRHGIIRAVGDPQARLAEDHLRALRAVRFASRLGFEIDSGTAQAIRLNASELQGVSRERIGEELRKMLSLPTRSCAIELIEFLGLDAPVLNEEPVGARPDAPRLASQLPQDASFPLALSAWAVDRALRGATHRGAFPSIVDHLRTTSARWRNAMCLSNAESGQMEQALKALESFSLRWSELGVAARKHLLASPSAQDARVLLGLIDADATMQIDQDAEHLAGDGVGINPAPFLTGDDLIGIGFRPGPRIGQTLKGAYDLQLEGAIRTLDEALQYARSENLE